MSHVVVIGAGQAGSSCVAKLRNGGFAGRVTLIGAETAPPYQRPPLSKAYLMGDMPLERLFLRPESFYAEHDIDLRLGVEVSAVDTAARTVTAGGEVLEYTDLVFATGSVPRHLPAAIGGDLEGVFVVRDLADVDAMAPRFVQGARVLIVGGGYIGLEAASVASKLGLDVVLVEMADRILQRVAAPETSDYFRALHGAHGVDIREGVGLSRLTGAGAVSGAELSDGSAVEVDFVIVGDEHGNFALSEIVNTLSLQYNLHRLLHQAGIAPPGALPATTRKEHGHTRLLGRALSQVKPSPGASCPGRRPP